MTYSREPSAQKIESVQIFGYKQVLYIFGIPNV